MAHRLPFCLVLISAFAVLAAAGCGGGGSMSPTSVVSGKAIHESSGGVCCNPPTFTPLAAAVISFTAATGGSIQTRTDTSGNYTVKLPAGTYTSALADRSNEPSYTAVDPSQIVVPANSSISVDITFQLLAP